ncbi:MAG: LPXTG cell wall anchor domain-containing protein, partial [Tissierellia bacterium]|nr:LPXTG cell wall anchor domain-containing protein [Tissierellia bacterium]
DKVEESKNEEKPNEAQRPNSQVKSSKPDKGSKPSQSIGKNNTSNNHSPKTGDSGIKYAMLGLIISGLALAFVSGKKKNKLK